MTQFQQISDGLQNVVSGMGTERDKAAATSYVPHYLTDDQIEAAYSSSKLAQKIIDMPAEDAGREWREWQAPGADISKIEAEEKRLNIKGKLIEALKCARLRGGAGLLIGTGDSDTGEPLDASKVGLGGLKYVAVIQKHDLAPGEVEDDPREPLYGRPKYYQINTKGAALIVHPSRLVILNGAVVPGGAKGWGESILNSVLDAVQRDESTAANVGSLVFEAKVDVLKVKDLTANLRNKGAEYEALLLRRFRLANLGKGINGSLLLDAEEEYEQKAASFGGLPDLMDRFALRVSAAAEIPMPLLFGQSPGGLNSTGDSETRAYYDRVKVRQSLDLEPEMSVLDECIVRSALGDRPAEIHYNWCPLWQPSAKEKAENADKLMSAIEKLDRLGSVPTEAIASAAVNALTESGAFPGLEGAVADFGDFEGVEDE